MRVWLYVCKDDDVKECMVIIMFGRYVYVCKDDDVKACMVVSS